MRIVATALTASLLVASSAAAHEDETRDTGDYLAAICSAAGNWSGNFEQYNADGLYRTSRFDAQFGCSPGAEILWETNLFYDMNGVNAPTMKVIFPVAETGSMQMSYFYGGIETVYFFDAVQVDYIDSLHWRVARASASQTHTSDEAPPISRYTHIREGNTLTMIRDVKPDADAAEWTLSAKLVMKLQP